MDGRRGSLRRDYMTASVAFPGAGGETKASKRLQSQRPSGRDAAEEQDVLQSSGPTNENRPKQSSPEEVPELFC